MFDERVTWSSIGHATNGDGRVSSSTTPKLGSIIIQRRQRIRRPGWDAGQKKMNGSTTPLAFFGAVVNQQGWPRKRRKMHSVPDGDHIIMPAGEPTKRCVLPFGSCCDCTGAGMSCQPAANAAAIYMHVAHRSRSKRPAERLFATSMAVAVAVHRANPPPQRHLPYQQVWAKHNDLRLLHYIMYGMRYYILKVSPFNAPFMRRREGATRGDRA
jgi:hypothetical protein